MITSILNGIRAYFGTFELISKLKLWKYFAIPILITFITGILFMTLAYFLAQPLGNFVAKIWIWDWGSETFRIITKFISVLLILALGLILYKHIVMALSAPFMSPVSEKVEAYLTQKKLHHHRQTTFGEQLARGIRVNTRNLFKELGYVIPLLLLSFIPLIGVIATIFIFIIQAYYVGFGNMDYTMERHFTYKESVAFVKKNKGTAIGNGIIFILMLFIPVIGLVLTLPISVVAASTETIKLLEKQHILSNIQEIEVEKLL